MTLKAPSLTRRPTVTIETTKRMLAQRARPAALIRFAPSAPGRPIIWGVQELAALEAALDQVDPEEVEAVVLIGADNSFGAGADLEMIRAAATAADAEDLAREGCRIFSMVSDLPLPSFALITGPALGGGLELALHADYRVARSDAKALGFPETRLGLVPGWGGTYLLPHLIGPEAALQMIAFDPLRGRTITPEKAADLGLVDCVIDRFSWDGSWPEWVGERLDNPSRKLPPGSHPTFTSEWAAAVAAARADSIRFFGGAAPAPLAAIDLIAAAKDSSAQEAMSAAAKTFGAIRATHQGKASLYAQQILTARTKRRTHATQPGGFRSAAVIGAGLMAGQLAALIAGQADIPVRMTDINKERLDSGVRRVHESFAAQARRGKISPEEARRRTSLVTAAPHLSELAHSDFVIEAVFEDLSVKRNVFADLERIVSPTAVLATNTSSLSITEMAAGLQHPERVVGFHVFNPVDIVRLVEIIGGAATDSLTLDRVNALAAKLKRIPVTVADAPGFAVNRLLTRMFDGILTLIDTGAAPEDADHCLDSLGLPMTPLQLLDFVGPAVQLHVCETMHAAYPGRFSVPASLKAVVRCGIHKTLSPDGTLTPAAREIFTSTNLGTRPTCAPPSRTAMQEQVLEALARETRIMLDEGVVADASEIDICMILGANYPPYLGGLTPLLDYSGASERTSGALFHPGMTEGRSVRQQDPIPS